MFSNIQALRAIAAIIVFFHHAEGQYGALNGQFGTFNAIAQRGFLGVDVFFVISGFVIFHTTINKERNMKNALTFLKLRFFRVYLGYFPFFLMSFFAASLFVPNSLENINLLGSFFLIESNMYALLLPVTWSLTYELYFYLIFFAFFALNSNLVRNLIPVIFFLLIIYVTFFYTPSNSIMNFLLSPFIIEFFLGALLYIIFDRIKSKVIMYISIIFTFVFYGVGFYIDVKNGPLRVLTLGGGSFFLVLVVLNLEHFNIFKSKGFIVDLGASSYSLYLSHLIFIQFFYFSGLRDYLFDSGQIVSEIGFYLFLVISVVLSHLYYKIVEIKVYNYFKDINFKSLKIKR